MKLKETLKRFAPVALMAVVVLFWVFLLADKISFDINHNIIIYGGVVLLLIGFSLLFNKE